MTKDEERARIGEAALEYGELNKQCSLLRDELRKSVDLFSDLQASIGRGDCDRILEHLQKLPDKATLVETTQKLKGAERRREELKVLLQPYGIS